MKKVAVVILNYKVKDYTLACIRSVRKSSYPNIEIIVVDNNSQDDLEKEISGFREVKFIQAHANLGYTGGNNLGIKQALKDNADYVFILNPDTEVKPDCIQRLIVGMVNEGVAVAGSKILFADHKTIWFAGGIMDLANVLHGHRGVDEKDKGQYEVASETDYVTGGAMMVRSDVFQKIGFLDDRYFMYYEDSDFCFRAKKAGFKIFYFPSAVIYHENAKSAGLGSPFQDYFITRNRMLFAAKFLSLRIQLALLREAVRNIKIPARRLALLDYLLSNYGKGSFLK